jgi:cytochrome c biogenesis protein CcmG, thiol:disulfide interchange protein DsbE
MRFVVPLGAFLLLAAFLTAGLRVDPQLVPSPLIGHVAPAFQLPLLQEPARTFTPIDVRGRVWMLNVWASWCVSCRAEHALLRALAEADVVPLYGLDYKDTPENALAFLGTYGDPYVLSMQDTEGRVAIDYGVYGVPETYLIDKAGVIRFKQVGPITRDSVEGTIVPMVEQLNR